MKQEKARGLLARSDALEADYAELLDLIPDVQSTLDNTTAPTSLKQDKVNQLSTLVGKICTFSALLTPRQASKLQVVQGQIRRFKQSIKRGVLDTPSHTACVDLSTSLNDLGEEVEYSPELARPPAQPVALQQPTSQDPDEAPPENPPGQPDEHVNKGTAPSENPVVEGRKPWQVVQSYQSWFRSPALAQSTRSQPP